jgi:hypothetical protein
VVKPLARMSVLAVCLGILSFPVSAQEVIHALTGTVTAIDKNAKTITVLQDGGSRAVFKEMTNAETPIVFDKKVAAETTAANAYETSGAYAIVFYYGDGPGQTVVALKNLGPGPFTETVGTVKKFEGRAHSILVEDNAGMVQTIKINPATVAETDFGVVEGMKFQAREGDQVRVVSTALSGTPTALFIGGR